MSPDVRRVFRRLIDRAGQVVDPVAATEVAEAFFALDPASRERAEQICDTCPVRARCLTEALDQGHDVGIWGGLEPEQRRAMRAAAVRDRGAAA